jgi:midasin
VCQGEALWNTPNKSDKPRFEWIDGLLVTALERGDWLVLDNANLCSSSVLDRLNSLLEPNGTLIINEHASQNGETCVIIPHPGFRIFLTMDPRNGELSRAMRNRAIELFVPMEISMNYPPESTPLALESKLDRFSQLTQYASNIDIDMSEISFDAMVVSQILSLEDLRMVSSFQGQLHQGLLGHGKLKMVQELEQAINNKHPVWVSKASEFVMLVFPSLEDGPYLQVCYLLSGALSFANYLTSFHSQFIH